MNISERIYIDEMDCNEKPDIKTALKFAAK
jgi:hypothetical protein